MMGEATGVSPTETGLRLELAGGEAVTARAVILATGVSYRRLGIPELDGLAGAGVYFGASVAEGQAFAGEPVFVVGGGNSAGQAALHLARQGCDVTVLVRRDALEETMSSYLERLSTRPRTSRSGSARRSPAAKATGACAVSPCATGPAVRPRTSKRPGCSC